MRPLRTLGSGVQGWPLQNVLLWHVDYFKLKTIKTQPTQQGGLPRLCEYKESTYQSGDARGVSSIPGSGKLAWPRTFSGPEVGNANPLQYSCLENSMGRGDWWTTVWGHKKLDTTCRLDKSFFLLLNCLKKFRGASPRTIIKDNYKEYGQDVVSCRGSSAGPRDQIPLCPLSLCGMANVYLPNIYSSHLLINHLSFWSLPLLLPSS